MRKFEQLSYEEVLILEELMEIVIFLKFRPELHHMIQELTDELELRG